MRNQTLHNLAAPVNAWRIVTVALAGAYLGIKVLHWLITSSQVSYTVPFGASQFTTPLSPSWPEISRFLGTVAVIGLLVCIYIRREEDDSGTWRMFGVILLFPVGYNVYLIAQWAMMNAMIPDELLADELKRVLRLIWFVSIASLGLVLVSAIAFTVPFRYAKWILIVGLAIPVTIDVFSIFPVDNPAIRREKERNLQRLEEEFRKNNEVPEELKAPTVYESFEEGAATGADSIHVREGEQVNLYIKVGNSYDIIEFPDSYNGAYARGEIPLLFPDWPMTAMYIIMLAYMFAPKHRIPRMRRLGEAEAP